MSSAVLLYLVSSLIAVALLALLLHRLGYSQEAYLVDEAAARQLLQTDFPDTKIGKVYISSDGRGALFDIADQSQIAALMVKGAFWQAAKWGKGDVATIATNGEMLRLTPSDMATSPMDFYFSSEQDMLDWYNRLQEYGICKS
ncbi:MAG: hypothetical protein ACWA5L_03765 [bacterium]